MNKTLIDRYFQKSGDETIFQDNMIENEHGFMSYREQGDKLVVLNVYGDGEYWDDEVKKIAKEKGLSKIWMGTRRNYKVFERKYGFRLIGYVLEREVQNG